MHRLLSLIMTGPNGWKGLWILNQTRDIASQCLSTSHWRPKIFFLPSLFISSVPFAYLALQGRVDCTDSLAMQGKEILCLIGSHWWSSCSLLPSLNILNSYCFMSTQIRWFQFPSLGIGELLRRSNQTGWISLWEALFGYIKWWRITRKLNKFHRIWDEEVIPLSNQVIPVSQFGNSTASSSFQSNQDESLRKKLDLDT